MDGCLSKTKREAQKWQITNYNACSMQAGRWDDVGFRQSVSLFWCIEANIYTEFLELGQINICNGIPVLLWNNIDYKPINLRVQTALQYYTCWHSLYVLN